MCVETACVLIIINRTLASGCLTVADNGELGLTREVGLTSLADLDWCRTTNSRVSQQWNDGYDKVM